MQSPNAFDILNRVPLGRQLLWLTMAVSAFVYIEPAPYDVLLISLVIVFLLFGLRVPKGLHTAAVLLGVFLLANMVASLVAKNPMATIRPLGIRIYMVVAWVFFASLITQGGPRVLGVIWNGYTVAAIIATCAGIVGYFGLGGNPEQLLENGRVRAFFKDPNVYGPFLIPPAFYALARYQFLHGRRAAIQIGLFLFFSLGILLGFSRGSWGNYAVTLLTYLSLGWLIYRRDQRLRLMRLILALALCVPVLLVGALSSPKVADMVETRARLVQYYDAGEGGRFDNQFDIIQRAAVTPLGLGAGQSSGQIYFRRDPHNIYLHVLIESGWLGALAYYAFLGLTLAVGFRSLRQPPPMQSVFLATYACLVGTLAQSFLIDSTHWRHLYLLFGMVWGLSLRMAAASAHPARVPAVSSGGTRTTGSTA